MMRHEVKQNFVETEHRLSEYLSASMTVVRTKLSEERAARLKLEENMQNFGS